MSIEKHRREIDHLDHKIMHLLYKRFHIAKEIAKEKKKEGLDIKDKKRERKVLRDKSSLARRYSISVRFTKKLFTLIMKESRRVQKKAVRGLRSKAE